MKRICALVLAKSDSKRLKSKNTIDFYGQPMFMWSVDKALRVFDDVYVSSDSNEILAIAVSAGAIPIKRHKSLCGDTPNIPCYQHAYAFMGAPDAIVAIQANSPTIKASKILRAKQFAEREDFVELMTIHEDTKLYGSIWAMNKFRLLCYPDPLKPNPNILMAEDSVDIHTKTDFKKALKQMEDNDRR